MPFLNLLSIDPYQRLLWYSLKRERNEKYDKKSTQYFYRLKDLSKTSITRRLRDNEITHWKEHLIC